VLGMFFDAIFCHLVITHEFRKFCNDDLPNFRILSTNPDCLLGRFLSRVFIHLDHWGAF
jgi:hypothetical protein